MSNMPPTQVQNWIDHASVQSDRWLMIALLVVILIGGGWLIRMVLGAMMRQMTEIVEEFKKDRDAFAGVIRENTKAATAHAENARTQSEALRDLARSVERCNRATS